MNFKGESPGVREKLIGGERSRKRVKKEFKMEKNEFQVSLSETREKERKDKYD